MEPKKISIICTFLLLLVCPIIRAQVNHANEVSGTDLVPKSTSDVDGKRTNDIAADEYMIANQKTPSSLISIIPETEYKKRIQAAASQYISKSLNPVTGLVIPSELSSRVKSTDELIALLNSPKQLASLSATETLSLVSVLTSSPAGLLTILPTSAVVNLLTTLCSTPELFAKLPHHTLYSLLTVFTVRPYLLSSLPTSLSIQFASGLFSLSPGVLHNVPTSILVNFLGSVCSTNILGSLSGPELVNFVTLLSLSPSLVKGLPVTGFVSLVDFLGTRPNELSDLPPSTLFRLMHGLFETMSDSSLYLLNDSTTASVVKLFTAILVPSVLNVLPPDTFNSLLAIFWSSPALLTSLPAANVVAILQAIASSPNLLVSVNTSHLEGLLTTIANTPALFKAIPTPLIVELMNALVAYLPRSVSSMQKSTLSKLLGVEPSG